MKWLTLILFLAFVKPSWAAPDDEAYFRQFLYHSVTQDSGDPDFPGPTTWYYLGSNLPFLVSYSATQDLFLDVEVYLNSDFTYLLLYQDNLMDKGSNSWVPRKCFVLTGKWAVPDKELQLYDENGKTIFSGGRALDHGRNSVAMKIQPDFSVPEVRGAAQTFVVYQSSQEPTRTCWPN